MRLKKLLNISDLSKENIIQIINKKSDQKILENKSIGMIFEKYSTRTRLSFAVAISQLGGQKIDIKFEELNISRDESFEDTFKTMSCYLDGLIYRTSDHLKLIKASKYFGKPIINALSDISHPCQILSDLYTLNSHFKNLNLNILWVGDMNNVCFSLVELCNIFFEIKLTILTPNQISSTKNWILNKNINITPDKKTIDFKNINCVMTDVFISMNDHKDNIEKETLLKDYQVDNSFMNKTNDNCLFMHCLPAKIGSEVTKDVIEGNKSIVWKQAKNRMIFQKKLLQCIDW